VPGVRLGSRLRQELLHLGIGPEVFSFLDSQRKEESHRHHVLLQDGLIIDHFGKVRVEALVEADDAVEELVRHVDETLLRWIARLWQRINATFLYHRDGAIQVSLQAAGLPIPHGVNIHTSASDPNSLLGRPGEYTSKTEWEDLRYPLGDDAADCGVEVFPNASLAKKRAAYIQSLMGGLLGTEHDYLAGPVLLTNLGQADAGAGSTVWALSSAGSSSSPEMTTGRPVPS
jgi:hypothetical protein